MITTPVHPSRRARAGRLAAAVALVVTVALSLLSAPASAAAAPVAADGAAATRAPMLWGDVGYSKRDILAREAAYGRKLTLYRAFKDWDEGISANMIWARDTGHIPVLSIKAAANGRLMSFRSIATAGPGSAIHNKILDWGRQLKAYRAPLYVSFNHEPDTVISLGSGGARDFVAAYRKVVGMWRSQGVTNARWTLVLYAYNFKRPASHPQYAPRYYPGDDVVDVIGVDAYNWYRCDPRADWREMSQLLDGFRSFAARHPAKKLMVAEYGSTEDPARPGRKAQWIRNTAALFAQPGYEQFIGLTAWRGHGNCGFDMASSPLALDAFRDMGQLPVYEGTRVR
jgi:hypothetical protein